MIRAHQVLHTEDKIPKDLLDNFGGEIPPLKGVHYYALTQIVKSVPDCARQAEAIEVSGKAPYVVQFGAAFTSTYTANGKTYAPSRSVREQVRKPFFVSAVAAAAANSSAPRRSRLVLPRWLVSLRLTPPFLTPENGAKRARQDDARNNYSPRYEFYRREKCLP